MYRRRLSQPFPAYPNLKLVLEKRHIHDHYCRFALMLRQVSKLKVLQNVKDRMELIIRHNKLLEALGNKITAVPKSLRNESAGFMRVCARQCECIFAQQLRRGQQMFCMYSKLWEEKALREFIRQLRHRLSIKSRHFLMGAIGVGGYDWQANRIPESEIKKHSNELKYVYTLKEKTLCGKCNKNSKICKCQGEQKPVMNSYDDWTVFIEKNDLVVWRRLRSGGNYEYKVYGSYDDVTGEDFLNVQIDINYRRQWDKTAVVLTSVESDPDPNSKSDILYWEMLWPTLFANRDYVFNRRYLIDYASKTLFLVSKSTKHPCCPKDNKKYRIEDYWSFMVIKPYTELNKPGVEFVLTYYDNPGVNIPASVTTWVAMKAMPDFLERLREASRKYKKYCKDSGLCRICNIIEPQSRYSLDYFLDLDDVTDNTVYEAHYRPRRSEEDLSDPSPQRDGDLDGFGNSKSGFWRYLHPTYYFS